MSVTPEIAEKYNLETLSQLIDVAPELRLGCTVEFIQREDCLPLFESEYNTSFKSKDGLDASIRYAAIESGEVDVIDAFSTDALLAKSNLVNLEDDISFFPPYYAVNLVRNEVLEEYPELSEALSQM